MADDLNKKVVDAMMRAGRDYAISIGEPDPGEQDDPELLVIFAAMAEGAIDAVRAYDE